MNYLIKLIILTLGGLIANIAISETRMLWSGK